MENRKFKFYKDVDSKWYVDLPEWNGDKWELEMVCGADTMLELFGQGDDTVHLTISLTPIESENDELTYKLTKIQDTPDLGGALYMLKEYYGIEYNLEVWLCHVLTWLFKTNPDIIYIA